MASIFDETAYRLLRLLSHPRNRLTNAEIVAQSTRYVYDPETPEWFMSFVSAPFVGGHLDLRGKTVLDVGCGYGDLCMWLVEHGAAEVHGVDVDPLRVEAARRLAAEKGVEHQVKLACADFVNAYLPGTQFDLVLSLDAFEHIPDPLACLRKIHALLKPGGVLATLFGPLWYSPYGAHMWGFTSLPWVHLFFPEAAVLRVRAEYFRPDQPAERYETVAGYLSRMTVSGFRRYALEAGFHPRIFRLNPDKDINRGGLFRPLNDLINATPGLQELGAQLLLAILERPVSG
ncbi:MAG: class I SAM-dependent methyltransferase [Anaerolineales bacterium]